MENQCIPQNSFWFQIQTFMMFIWMALVDAFQTFINIIKSSEKSKELSSNISENMEKGNLLSGNSTSSDCSETYSPSNEIAWSPVNMTAKEAKETQERMSTDKKITPTKSWADFSDSEAEHVKNQIQETPIEVEKLEVVEEVVEEVSSTESDSESGKSESEKSENDPASFVEQTEVKKLSESAPEPEKKKKKTRRGKRNNKKLKESTSDSEVSSLKNTQTNTNPKRQNSPKKNAPNREKEEDDRFIHFRKRRDQNYHNNNNNNINNTNFSRHSISPAYHALTGKHEMNEAPRKFSHSLMPKLRDEVQETVRPVRQPIGPMLGSNGFSSEYRRSRVLAV